MPAPPILPGTVKTASPGLTGFDVDFVLDTALVKQYKDMGYTFCCRYLSRDNTINNTDLTNAEAQIILNAGMALIAVQHAPPSPPPPAPPSIGWSPSGILGSMNGGYAVTNAQNVVGLPTGMNIWCDLEGVTATAAATDVIAYCQAWYKAVAVVGYVPGLYVGAGIILTSAQLYNDLSFQHYWQAYNGKDVITRGFQLIQKQKTVKNSLIDEDTTQNDSLGGSLLWLSA